MPADDDQTRDGPPASASKPPRADLSKPSRVGPSKPPRVDASKTPGVDPTRTVDDPTRTKASGVVHRPAADFIPRITGYEITGRLGEGGMGVVWKAIQLSTKREVALKLMSAAGFASEKARMRFEREVELTAKLDHPNIARVYDSGLQQGVFYYAMELVGGQELDLFVKENRLPARTILELMQRVCQAVQHAHQKGVIHRDLKPANILITPDGQPHVLDFGLAKATQGDGSQPISIDGDVAGTPAYMSPEQAAGKLDQLDTRSDVYTLGVILFRLLSGEFPHEPSGSAFEMMRRITDTEPLRLSKLQPKVDREVDAIVGKALEKEPERRYGSAAGLAADLGRYLAGEPVTARPATLRYLLAKKGRKYRVPLAIAALVLCGFIGLAIYDYARVARERNAARQSEARAVANEGLAVQSAAAARQSAHQAKVELGDSLLAQADALGLTARWRESLDRYRAARSVMKELGEPTLAADLGAWETCRASAVPLATLPAPQLYSAALSADGRTAVVGNVDGTLTVFDMFLGRQVRTLGQPSPGTNPQFPDDSPTAVKSVVFAPDGRHVMSGGRDRMLSYWDLTTGERVQQFGGYVGSVQDMAFTKDGKYVLAGGSTGGQVALWDVATGKTAMVFAAGLIEHVHCVALSPNGRLAFSGRWTTSAPRLELWDVATGTLIRRFGDISASLVFCAAFYADNRHLAIGTQDGKLQLFDTSTGREVRSFVGHVNSVTRVAFTPDGQSLVSAGSDKTIRFWDLGTARITRTLPGEDVVNQALALSADGSVLLSGSVHGVNLWGLAPPREARPVSPLVASSDISRAAFSPDGNGILLGGEGSTSLYDAATGLMLRKFADSQGDGMVFASDRIAWAGGGKLLVFDPATGERVSSVSLPPKSQFRTISPDGRRAVCRLENKKLAVLDMTSGQQICLLDPGPVSDEWPRFSSDGKRLLTVENPEVALPFVTHHAAQVKPEIAVWDADTGRELVHLRGLSPALPYYIKPGPFAPDGKSVFVRMQASVRQVDLADGRVIQAFDGHANTVNTLALSTDGRVLATGSGDRTVRVWEVASGRELRTLVGHPGDVRSLTISTAGGRLAVVSSGSGNSTILWDLGRGTDYYALVERLGIARERLRDSPTDAASLAAVGEWCAFQGAWAWASELLNKAAAGGAVVSPLLLARCRWQAGGDAESVAADFRRAGEAGEVSSSYASLCTAAARQQLPFLVARNSARLPGTVSFTPSTAPATSNQANSEWTDLLPLVDVKRFGPVGTWAVRDTVLTVQPADKPLCKLAIPIIPKGDYEFEVTFRRLAGKNDVALLLPVGRRQTSVNFGWGSDGNNDTFGKKKRSPTTVKTNQVYTVRATVRTDDEHDTAQIDIALNGRPYLSFAGPGSEVEPAGGDWKSQRPGSLGLGAYDAPVEFTAIRFRLLSGMATRVTE